MKIKLLFGLLFLGVAACQPVAEVDPIDQDVEGLRPVYASSDWRTITADNPRQITRLGKIYYKDETIYAVEQFQGIHIIDNSDPTDPVRTGFLNVVGVRDVAIKGNVMYVDNATDLVSLDVSDITDPKVLSRFEGLYPNLDQGFPQGYEGPFECVDDAAGLVIGWETATLTDPKCFR